MKFDSNVDLTYVSVILKFGCDQINISYKNAQLKNMSNPMVNMPNTLKVTELCSTNGCANTGRSDGIGV